MAKDRDIFKWFIHSVLFEPSPGYGFAPGALATVNVTAVYSRI